MLDITIEDVSPRDLSELHRIEEECFGKEAFTRQQLAHLLEDYSTISLSARQGRVIVGFVMGLIYRERESDSAHILTIDVALKDRRKGVGVQLLKAIERIFRERGVRRCSLEVREDNVAALRLYEKFGYVQVQKLKNYYMNGNGLLLTKNL